MARRRGNWGSGSTRQARRSRPSPALASRSPAERKAAAPTERCRRSVGAQDRAGGCLRRGALPAGRPPVPALGRRPCRAVGPPATPSAGPFPHYGNTDIQRERLASTAAPRLPQRGSLGRRTGLRAPCTPELRRAGRQQARSLRRPRPPAAAGQPPSHAPEGETSRLGLLRGYRTGPALLEGPCLTACIWQSFSSSSWAARCRARAPLPCLR